MDLKTKMHTEMIRFLVQRAIICPATGKVLDYRTCAVLLDADGDPHAVFSPDVKEAYKDLLTPGFSWMER